MLLLISLFSYAIVLFDCVFILMVICYKAGVISKNFRKGAIAAMS